ncbi:DUF6760 family protein [Embleya sp. NPDC005971]|uniref:DUF6760 family protein n=1 Tax=unclassified Embleya TaxID=2699296 RepID=UPI00340CE646
MRGYPVDRLREEIAFVAYHLHWSHAELMGLDHGERRRWVERVSAINQRLNEAN